jgi:hypothetical protein
MYANVVAQEDLKIPPIRRSYAYNSTTGRAIDDTVFVTSYDREKIAKLYNLSEKELNAKINHLEKYDMKYSPSTRDEYKLLRVAKGLKKHGFPQAAIEKKNVPIPSYGVNYYPHGGRKLSGNHKTRRNQMRKRSTRKNRK